jgi:hypothetical protein
VVISLTNKYFSSNKIKPYLVVDRRQSLVTGVVVGGETPMVQDMVETFHLTKRSFGVLGEWFDKQEKNNWSIT